MSDLIVAKFGGTSVADIDRIRASADKIIREAERGHQIAVVVSAMAGETDRLISLCSSFTADNDSFEKDSIVATGEQVSAGLFALALKERGFRGRSFQAWQAGITGEGLTGRARITDMDSEHIKSLMADKVIPVFTGFQAKTKEGRMITLGRGGSDTSAVAIAAGLQADRCDIYTDVDGVYSADPRIVPNARKHKVMPYDAMLEMASVGAKVLQTRSVMLAMKRDVPLQILSSMGEYIGSDMPGTVLRKEKDTHMEGEEIYGIAHKVGEAKVTLIQVKDRPGIAATIMDCLAERDIQIDMIVQNMSIDGSATDMTFTLPESDLDAAMEAFKGAKLEGFSSTQIKVAHGMARVSVIGVGMNSHTHVGQKMFRTLADHGINIHAITSSEIKISALVDEAQVPQAVKALHEAFELEAE